MSDPTVQAILDALEEAVEDCYHCGGTNSVRVPSFEDGGFVEYFRPLPDEKRVPCPACGPYRLILETYKSD